MLSRSLKTSLGLLLAGVVVGDQALLRGQDLTPPPAIAGAPAPTQTPEVQKGVEVLTRGPIHEAFASLTAEAVPTAAVGKAPPKPIEEMPPAEKPDGEVTWIGGYWAWDDDRADYLWVSGTWRTVPPGKQWVAGYWREDAAKYQWVPGFWTTAAAKDNAAQEVTYLPQPPAAPNVAPPNEKPNPESFYVPGHWVWKADHYGWQSGYWAKVEPGYVWVNAHYRWTPSGYIYIGGYWDYAVSRRGMLYAPVFIDPNVVVVGYVYTPHYAVHDTVVIDSLWVRPSHCHYYFGDYYGVEYRDRGFESCVVYSRGHYDSIIVYETYEHRREPDWITIRINVHNDRYEHRESRPPRTLVEQVRIGGTRVTVVAPAARVAEARGTKVVIVDHETRVQAKEHAVVVREVSTQRVKTEVAAPGGAPKQPHVASLQVPQQQPVVAKPTAAATPPAMTSKTTVTPAMTPPTTAAASGTKPPTMSPPVTTAGATVHPTTGTTTTTPPAMSTAPPAVTSTKPATLAPPVTPGNGNTAAQSTTPAVTPAVHPTTPAVTTTTPPPTTVKPGTPPVPPPPPPPGGSGTTTTKPGTTTPGMPANQVTTKPGTQPPGTTQTTKPVDPNHKPPPGDKDKDKDKKDKDKDKNQ